MTTSLTDDLKLALRGLDIAGFEVVPKEPVRLWVKREAERFLTTTCVFRSGGRRSGYDSDTLKGARDEAIRAINLAYFNALTRSGADE